MANFSSTVGGLGLPHVMGWVDQRVLHGDMLDEVSDPGRGVLNTLITSPIISHAISHIPTARSLQRRAVQIAPVEAPKPAILENKIDLDSPLWDRVSMAHCLAGPSSEHWADWVHRELDDTHRRTIPVLQPAFLRYLAPERLAQLVKEIIIRIRTMVAPGNEHLLNGDTTPFERVCWKLALDVVPQLICEAAKLNAIHPERYPVQLAEELEEYFKHEIRLKLQMEVILGKMR